jgi:hypothetical protein
VSALGWTGRETSDTTLKLNSDIVVLKHKRIDLACRTLQLNHLPRAKLELLTIQLFEVDRA